MNLAVIMGRLTKDPDTRVAQSGKTVTRLTVAVDRYGKDAGSDFIGCVAFDKSADFISKYFHKGSKILITGHIQTDSYEKNGQKVYTKDIIVDRAEFVEKKVDAPESIGQPDSNPSDEFMKLPDGIDEEIPFQ